MAQQLLDASPLCAIATVGRDGRAHINTAYFAWSPQFEVVWLSDPQALHSKNIRTNESVAVAVYDSNQMWSNPDRGIQLFGTAREARVDADPMAERVYAARFGAFRPEDVSGYRLYVMRVTKLKLFDERTLGAGTFVSARVTSARLLEWVRTDVYATTTATPRRR